MLNSCSVLQIESARQASDAMAKYAKSISDCAPSWFQEREASEEMGLLHPHRILGLPPPQVEAAVGHISEEGMDEDASHLAPLRSGTTVVCVE